MANFSQFTQKYPLSKTLRFELKPVGKTLDHLRRDQKYDPNLQTFLKDQDIEDAYQTLKPIFDKIHEDFITRSLESETAKRIDFYKFLEAYRNRKNDEKTLDKEEKSLREEIGKTYLEGEKWIKERAGLDEKGKVILTEKGYKCLTELGILKYIEKHKSDFLDIRSEQEISKSIDNETGVGKFFTYFSGFNINRENYYTTDKEKSTAIATRIVHENLPKFCDNISFFENQKNAYLGIYKFLKDQSRITEIKDRGSGKMKEIYDITEDIFMISHFSICLSQKEIEEYNRVIGHYNQLINLYNQANSKNTGFTKLPLFKELYKQIGCGKKESFIKAITHNTEADIQKDKNTKDSISVESILKKSLLAGKKYFTLKSLNNELPNTVPDFLDWLRGREDWRGIYWSKTAINSISNIYFKNWSSIKELIKNDKTLASFDKHREEQIKINDAVELSGLFSILDISTNDEWKNNFFKNSITDNPYKKRIIDVSSSPSRALIALIADFVESNMREFLSQGDMILEISDYKSEEGKEAIKSWMDKALAINQALKYFRVKESKTKGEVLSSELVNILSSLLDTEDAKWFDWYDLLRNYLTKKPQDDAMENKLKLNFESGSLLGGWSDGQEKIKKAVLIRNEGNFYLGILKKSSLFDTENEDNPIYRSTNGTAGRLILANLKFQTLAGKGFLSEFKESYGDMGKRDPIEAIKALQKIIRDRYQKKYPLLERIAKTEYTDKKDFDKDIQETLTNCYVCEFRDISWIKIQEFIESGDLYLFQISSKDSGNKSYGNKNLQTLYWEALFFEDSVFQLCGGGEIFYRMEAIKEKEIKELKTKNSSAIIGKRFTKNNDLELINELSPEEREEFKKTNGKSFFFHCPIKINYKATGSSNPKFALSEHNNLIIQELSPKSDIYFLGLDRGEKHLVYYSIVDQNGEMIDQGSLNEIGPGGKKVDYHTLLTVREGERMESRKNWQKIDNISKLKEGYISLVIHDIIKKLGTYPGFIVMEDLSTGFKRGRQKIEKSIYQKFELALAKKLNFVVHKSTKIGEEGSVTNALQLTPPVTNYGDIENQKQVGIMLYTRANYTSQTDPATGWRKTIYIKTGSEENIKEQIISNFSDIGFDGKDYFFQYFDKTGKLWTLYSGKNGKSLIRFRGTREVEKNIWKIESIDLVKMLDGIFINFDKSRSLLSQILDDGVEIKRPVMENGKEYYGTAWDAFRYAIDLIQQIRNAGDSSNREDDNFLLSPVRDEKGEHFDTRNKKTGFPQDADANGAYNIARKGLIMNEHIRQWKQDGEQKYKQSSDLNLFISDLEWDLWLTNREEWKKQLPIFSSKKQMELKSKNL